MTGLACFCGLFCFFGLEPLAFIVAACSCWVEVLVEVAVLFAVCSGSVFFGGGFPFLLHALLLGDEVPAAFGCAVDASMMEMYLVCSQR